ncbi:MAG: hypothetical protein AAFQ88_13150 [Pseudomonadota bacterium]
MNNQDLIAVSHLASAISIPFLFAIYIWQARMLRKQLKERRRQILVSSFNHFSSMYSATMKEIPKENDELYERPSWWYRYWDMMSAEAIFYRRGYIDDITFILWMQELARHMKGAPHDRVYMGTFEQNLESRLTLLAEIDKPLHDFFHKIKTASNKEDQRERGKSVQDAAMMLKVEWERRKQNDKFYGTRKK